MLTKIILLNQNLQSVQARKLKINPQTERHNKYKKNVESQNHELQTRGYN